MAFSIQRAVSDGTMTLLPISIEYFDREEISVLFNGVLNARQWEWVGTTDKMLSFTPAVADTVEVMIVRSTDLAELRHQFSLGAQFTAESLDESLLQILHIAQEASEQLQGSDFYNDIDLHGFKITNVAAGVSTGDAVNKGQMDAHTAEVIGYRDDAAASAAAAATSAEAAIAALSRAASVNFVSIKDFGADPTGLVDSTAAIQSAINSLGTGGGLVIPAGVYKITATLTLSGYGKSIVGIGRPELRKFGAGNFDGILVTGSGCLLSGFRINGNSVGWSGVVIKGEHNTVRDVVSNNNGGCGILLDGKTTTCSYNTVENCRCYSNGQIGIGQNTALASRILGNICQDNGLEGITIDLPSHRSIVDGNQVIGNCKTGGVGGIGIDQAYLTVISNNIISGTLSGLPGLTFQCNAGDTVFCVVTGNVFVDNAQGGIWLKKTGAYHSSFNVIDGNVFLNNGGKSITIDAGCDSNILGNNQYNGVWPADSGAKNRKQAGAVYFRVANNTVRTDVTGDATWYTVPFEVEQADTESTVASGIFTAPTKGLYAFDANVRLSEGASHTWGQLQFVTAGSASYTATLGIEAGTEDIFLLQGSTTFFLSAGDTVRVNVRVAGGPGTKVLDVEANINECWFSGYLVG